MVSCWMMCLLNGGWHGWFEGLLDGGSGGTSGSRLFVGLVGWWIICLVGRWVGSCVVGGLGGWLIGWWVDWSIGWLVGALVDRMVDWWIGLLVGRWVG
jgi:hypothetical protein